MKEISKISFTTFSPKKSLGHENYDKGLPIFVGILAGRATGIHISKVPATGEVLEGLKGDFRAVVGDDPRTGERYASGVAYMHPAFMGPIMAIIKESEGQTVEFCKAVFIKKAGNPAGYEWVAQEMRPTAVDPLATMLNDAVNATAQIANSAGPEVAKIENKSKAKAEAV